MNRLEAKDVIFGHAVTAWQAATAALGIVNPEMRFKDDGLAEPAQGTYWARFSTQTVDESQETLRNSEFQRRFVTVGLVFIQIFCPRSDDDAPTRADQLAEAMRNAFRDPRVDDNLEFTQATIDDNVRPEPAWIAVNVNARFWYRQFM